MSHGTLARQKPIKTIRIDTTQAQDQLTLILADLARSESARRLERLLADLRQNPDLRRELIELLNP
jgi:hypothetical protein